MPLLDLTKITSGLSKIWSGYLRDWDRSLRSGNYPETTRYNYLLAASQLAAYLGSTPRTRTPTTPPRTRPRSPRPTSRRSGPWMIDTRSASTALNKHKGLQHLQ